MACKPAKMLTGESRATRKMTTLQLFLCTYTIAGIGKQCLIMTRVVLTLTSVVGLAQDPDMFMQKEYCYSQQKPP